MPDPTDPPDWIGREPGVIIVSEDLRQAFRGTVMTMLLGQLNLGLQVDPYLQRQSVFLLRGVIVSGPPLPLSDLPRGNDG